MGNKADLPNFINQKATLAGIPKQINEISG